MDRNGASIYESERCQVWGGVFWSATRKGNTLYPHIFYWPGTEVSLGGLRNKVHSAKYFATGQPEKFVQDDFRVRLLNLPAMPPDSPVTTFALTLDGEPRQEMGYVRAQRKREGV
jgi:alpha-L-fucosidase